MTGGRSSPILRTAKGKWDGVDGDRESPMIAREIKQKIVDVVGPENVLDAELDRVAYSYDSSFIPLPPVNKPDIVVRPLTTSEVSKLMAVA